MSAYTRDLVFQGSDSRGIFHEPVRKYGSDSLPFGLSLIRFEGILLLLCGLTFALHLLRNKADHNDRMVALSLLPVAIVSAGFVYARTPARIFDYFGFTAFMACRIPRKYAIYAGVFLTAVLAMSISARNQDNAFLHPSTGEKEAASWIINNLNGTVYTDQMLASRIIMEDYYKVQSMLDNDPRNVPVYYSHDPDESLKALKSRWADYIAISRRMREDYILNLNVPQAHMINGDMYEKYYVKVYDNGDVRIYKVQLKTPENEGGSLP